MFRFGEAMAWRVVERFGVTRDLVEQRKNEFLAWLAEKGIDVPTSWDSFLRTWKAFREDVAGNMSLQDWILGLIIAAILGIGVALPIVVDTVNQVMGNLSGITATVVGVIPVAVAISLLLIFLGR